MKKTKLLVRAIAAVLVVLMIFSIISIIFTGCAQPTEPNTSDNTSSTQVPSTSVDFLAKGYKIRAVITPKNVATLDPLTFEVYVDAYGNGNGLLGYQDGVYTVLISGDKVYVRFGENTIINLSDVTGHMIPSSLSLNAQTNLSSQGFTLASNKVISFKSSTDSLMFDVSYQEIDTVFDVTTIASGNISDMNSLVSYILSYESGIYVGDTTPDDPEERESFYTNSWIGVTIRGNIYSIGDYCNPSTFYEGQTPEGILPEYAWNKDKRVEILHISYISSNGRTEFETTEGYIQSIYTTCPFEFLGISSGTPTDTLKTLLGIGLRKADQENFVPIVEGLVVESSSNNVFNLRYEGLMITLTCDNSKTLVSIKVTNYIDFRER